MFLGFLAPALRAQQPTVTPAAPSYEEGLFDLVTPGIAALPINVLVTTRGQYLLPLKAVLDALGVPVRIERDSALARITRAAPAGMATLRWRPTATLEADARIPLDSGEVVVRSDEIFVAAGRLETALGASLVVDFATLAVRAERPGGFPAQLIGEVRRQRAIRLHALPSQAPVIEAPFHPGTGFGVVEWGLGGSGQGVLVAPSTAELRLGAGLLGGMLKTRTALRLPGAGVQAGIGDQDASYQRVFPTGTWVRQLQLGDVTSEGAQALLMRGVTISNAPYMRGVQFAELPFSRPLPPGFEYEVYEGNQLLGYADAGTRTPLNIPLRYGTTPLRVRVYAPNGDVAESEISYVIPVEQLPAGDWIYAAGAGRCASSRCNRLAYGELRHGITQWLTVQGGVDGTRDTASTLHGYGAASFVPAPGWTASLQGRSSAYLRGSVESFVPRRVMGGMSLGVNMPGEGGTTLTVEQQKVYFAQGSLRIHGLPVLGERQLTVGSHVEARPSRGLGGWDLNASMGVWKFTLLEAGIQSGASQFLADTTPHGPLLRIAPTKAFSSPLMRRLGAPIVRVEAGLQDGGLSQWDVSVSLQPGVGFVNVFARHLAGAPGTQAGVGGTLTLGNAARLLARVTSRAGGVDASFSATGAAAFGSVRRATPLSYGGLGLAGVEGRVYRDLDADGKFGASDEIVTDAVVQIGGLRTTSDSSGRYSLWNARPYEPIEILLDSVTLGDPSWVPSQQLRYTRLSPQQYTRFDFPLVHTREVTGKLERERGVATTAGIGVVLREQSSGLAYEVRTFSDGAYYLTNVRPGTYTLEVAERSRQALGVQPASLRDLVVPRTGDAPVELPDLRLTLAGPPRP